MDFGGTDGAEEVVGGYGVGVGGFGCVGCSVGGAGRLVWFCGVSELVLRFMKLCSVGSLVPLRWRTVAGEGRLSDA